MILKNLVSILFGVLITSDYFIVEILPLSTIYSRSFYQQAVNKINNLFSAIFSEIFSLSSE